MALTVQNGVLILRNGALGTGQSCCCVPPPPPPPPPSGCCCVDGVFTDEYTTQADCTQCEDVYACSEYTFVECQYADPDENGQCPPGYTEAWWGGCEQCGDCPEGFTPDGFGGCFRETTVADCESCPGSCSYSETIGPCGTWSSTCQAAGCLFACCVCVRDYIEVECQVVEKVEGECPEGSQEAGERCFECDECPEGYTLSLGISQFGDEETEGVRYCVSDDASVECTEESSGACSVVGGFSVGPPKSDAGQSVCDSNPCAEFDCCQQDPCPPGCEWPEEITMTVSGIPDGYLYRCQGGCDGTQGTPPAGWGTDAVWRVVGTAGGFPCTVASKFPDDGLTVVLEKTSDSGCNGVQYTGAFEFEDGEALSCGGSGLAVTGPGGGSVSVSVSRDPRAGTFLTIETPEGGFGGGAAGIVVDYDDEGAITAVKLCSGGSGYAIAGEPVQVSTPTVVIHSATGGQGAEISAVVDDDPTSASFGQVIKLEIDNGGTGYGIGGYRIGFTFGSSFTVIPLAGLSLTCQNIPGPCVAPIFCDGDDISDEEVPEDELISKEKCGTDLLDKEYIGVSYNQIFPNGVGDMNGVTEWSLLDWDGDGFCDDLFILNGITVTLAPN
jgi:hypothetical protein